MKGKEGFITVVFLCFVCINWTRLGYLELWIHLWTPSDHEIPDSRLDTPHEIRGPVYDGCQTTQKPQIRTRLKSTERGGSRRTSRTLISVTRSRIRGCSTISSAVSLSSRTKRYSVHPTRHTNFPIEATRSIRWRPFWW